MSKLIKKIMYIKNEKKVNTCFYNTSNLMAIAIKLSLVIFTNSYCYADKDQEKINLRIGYPVVLKSMNEDGTGAYLESLRVIIGDKFKLNLIPLPTNRLTKMFLQKKLDGVFPDDPTFYKINSPKYGSGNIKIIHPKIPFYTHNFPVFFLKGKYKNWNNSYLETERFIWIQGEDLRSLNSEIKKFSTVPNIPAGIGFLEKGRADMFFSWEDDTIKAMKKSQKEEKLKKFEHFYTNLKTAGHLVLHNTSLNQKAIDTYDKNIISKKFLDQIEKIHQHYGVVFEIPNIEEPFTDNGEPFTDNAVGFYSTENGKDSIGLLDAPGNTIFGYYTSDGEKGFVRLKIIYEKNIAVGIWCTGGEIGPVKLFLEKQKEKTLIKLIYKEEYGDSTWKDDWEYVLTSDTIPKRIEKKIIKAIKKSKCELKNKDLLID